MSSQLTEYGTRGRSTLNANRRQDLPTARAEADQYGLEVVTRDSDGPWETWAGERPRLLDLFGGEGLAALGYAQAGFDVTSVEIDPERIKHHVRHPHIRVVEADATTYPLDGYHVVVGSPPCTDRSSISNAAEVQRGGESGTAWMLPHTIDRFRVHHARTGTPWVVENVEGARRSLPGSFRLCGTMFGLVDEGWWLKRHRLFASSEPIQTGMACRCRDGRRIIGIYGRLSVNDNRCSGTRTDRPRGDMRAGVDRARRLMGAPWASPRGLSLGLPVAYTRWIGKQLMALIGVPA